ncbi:DEAD/DEAH box helicase [Aneurinibacillus sp. REN35]|uniref:DEAD/DEAH box helicase n=1 Tax=Aneurinibacillus sp. REN35 TaxID=3237286 RepID=UPI00352806AC
MATFYEFELHHSVVRALTHMGLEEATPIQEQTIPLALEGKDVIGQAQTGTGKTAAFGIPLINRLNEEKEHIQGVVLTPTRELAVQVAEELTKIAKNKGVGVLPIYGGQDMSRQIRALKKKPQIIVATPGRFMDHMRRKTIRLNAIDMVVLDEADEMLNMGFIEDITMILEEMPEERQTLLFSATMSKPVQEIAQKFMKEPEIIRVKAKEMTVSNITQQCLKVSERDKFDVLCRFLDIDAPELAIVFGRTKRRVDELSEALHKRGYKADGIHGDLTQAKRDSVLRKFKEGRIDVLVATDVAARGLDISGVTHVYNFDLPQDPESYVHRIGRTGRAGKTGIAISFATPSEIEHIHTIETVTKKKMDWREAPTQEEAIEQQQRLTAEKLMEMAEKANLQAYRETAEQLLEEVDSVTLVSAVLKLMTKQPNTTSVKLTEEAPLRIKRRRPDHKGNRGNRGSGGRGGFGKGGFKKEGFSKDGGRGRNRSFQPSGGRAPVGKSQQRKKNK